MKKTVLTIGLNDKDREIQLIETSAAKAIIADILINRFDVFAFTMIDCMGVYRMNSTGHIVNESSIRLEIVTDEPMTNIDDIVTTIKTDLNQESIMVEMCEANVSFR